MHFYSSLALIIQFLHFGKLGQKSGNPVFGNEWMKLQHLPITAAFFNVLRAPPFFL
jgi:hypothetical protein